MHKQSLIPIRGELQPTKLTAPVQSLTNKIKFVGAELTVQKSKALKTAIYLGAMLNELKEQVGHGPFITLRRELLPDHSDDTCERYMHAAVNVVKQSGITIDIAPSRLLSAPDAELSEEHLEARQTVFDFMTNKTIKECISGVVLDGDEAHRITRAANGKKHGGTKGEDRKNYPQFIGEKLSDISSHLKFWRTYTAPQVEDVGAKLKSFVGKSPTPFLTLLKDTINQELKTR